MYLQIYIMYSIQSRALWDAVTIPLKFKSTTQTSVLKKFEGCNDIYELFFFFFFLALNCVAMDFIWACLLSVMISLVSNIKIIISMKLKPTTYLILRYINLLFARTAPSHSWFPKINFSCFLPIPILYQIISILFAHKYSVTAFLV